MHLTLWKPGFHYLVFKYKTRAVRHVNRVHSLLQYICVITDTFN